MQGVPNAEFQRARRSGEEKDKEKKGECRCEMRIKSYYIICRLSIRHLYDVKTDDVFYIGFYDNITTDHPEVALFINYNNGGRQNDN